MNWKCFKKEFLRWRIADYIMMIIVAIIAAVIGAAVRPHCREFSFDDPTIGHPFETHEAFPMYSVVLAVIFVCVFYFAGELGTRWNRPAGKISMGLHLNGWVQVQAFGILLAFAIVNILKLYAGRLRPDFLARMEALGVTAQTVGNFTHDELCDMAREGRLSFPSGHSGTIFAGFVSPSLYLLGLFRTLRGGSYWPAMIAMLPLILPITVAVSRTRDYRHNFDDILAGSVVGAASAIVAVLLNFTASDTGEWTLRDQPVYSDTFHSDAMCGEPRATVAVIYRGHRRERDDDNNNEDGSDELASFEHPNDAVEVQREYMESREREGEHAAGYSRGRQHPEAPMTTAVPLYTEKSVEDPRLASEEGELGPRDPDVVVPMRSHKH